MKFVTQSWKLKHKDQYQNLPATAPEYSGVSSAPCFYLWCVLMEKQASSPKDPVKSIYSVLLEQWHHFSDISKSCSLICDHYIYPKYPSHGKQFSGLCLRLIGSVICFTFSEEKSHSDTNSCCFLAPPNSLS